MAATKSALAIAQTVSAAAGFDPPQSLTEEGVGRQMLALMNIGLGELAEMRGHWGQGWPELNRTHVFTADGREDGRYDLPEDFSDAIQGTFWDRNQNRAMHGPGDPYYWAYLYSGLAARPAYTPRWRLRFDVATQSVRLETTPAPPDGAEIAFDYVSRNWLRSGAVGSLEGGGTPPVDLFEIEVGTEHPVIPAHLCVMDLLWRYKQAKGKEYRLDLGEANREAKRQFIIAAGGPQVIDVGGGLDRVFGYPNFPRRIPYPPQG